MNGVVERALRRLRRERDERRRRDVVAIRRLGGGTVICATSSVTVSDQDDHQFALAGGEWIAAQRTIDIEEVR